MRGDELNFESNDVEVTVADKLTVENVSAVSNAGVAKRDLICERLRMRHVRLIKVCVCACVF